MASKVFIIAGESSGDLHAAELVRALRKRRPDLRFHGIGGPKMQADGVDLLFPNSELAVVGLVEVLSHARPIVQAFRRTMDWLRRERPELLILIDYPGFNLRIARRAKALGIPIFYYISPQVWAWRQGRVKLLKKWTDRMAVILPFEPAFFEGKGMKVDFVGHPLLDVVRTRESREAYRRRLDLDPGRPLIGLLPGSRRGELRRILPRLLAAVREIRVRRPEIQFILPLAPSLERALVAECAGQELDPHIVVVQGETYEAMGACDVLFAASGTVTLEAAILDVPAVVTYVVSPLTYRLGRLLVKVPFASLVNLIAGRAVVPELIQEAATPEGLADAALRLLDDKAVRRETLAGLREVRERLGGPGAADRAADVALELLGR